MQSSTTIIWLLLFSGAFALLGMWYARRDRDSLEDYVIARNSQSTAATMLTLLASSLGAWILFSPAQDVPKTGNDPAGPAHARAHSPWSYTD
jgi:Na+/proline symporter